MKTNLTTKSFVRQLDHLAQCCVCAQFPQARRNHISLVQECGESHTHTHAFSPTHSHRGHREYCMIPYVLAKLPSDFPSVLITWVRLAGRTIVHSMSQQTAWNLNRHNTTQSEGFWRIQTYPNNIWKSLSIQSYPILSNRWHQVAWRWSLLFGVGAEDNDGGTAAACQRPTPTQPYTVIKKRVCNHPPTTQIIYTDNTWHTTNKFLYKSRGLWPPEYLLNNFSPFKIFQEYSIIDSNSET